MHTRSFVVAMLLVIAGGSAVGAQEKGQVGLVMGYPSSIGIVWHPTTRIAVRPAMSFSFASSDRTSILPTIPFDLGLSETVSHTTSRQLAS